VIPDTEDTRASKADNETSSEEPFTKRASTNSAMVFGEQSVTPDDEALISSEDPSMSISAPKKNPEEHDIEATVVPDTEDTRASKPDSETSSEAT
jgi:hypothetical protein